MKRETTTFQRGEKISRDIFVKHLRTGRLNKQTSKVMIYALIKSGFIKDSRHFITVKKSFRF